MEFPQDPMGGGGHVTISAEPGWGIEIEPEWLAKPVQVSDTG